MSIQNNYVAIMAGGIGSRFWPESRTSYPKQFLDLLGTGRSLVQWTYHRYKQVCSQENIYIITQQAYVATLRQQLPELPPENILAEPSRKETAACAAYFAHKIMAVNPKANILMTPADQLIMDERGFERTVYEAFDFVAHHNSLLTLGMKPTKAHTGYGYIQYDADEQLDTAFRVKTFTEKPSLDLARDFLKSGDFLWNSGMYLWNVQTFMDILAEQLPEMHEVLLQGSGYYNTYKETEIINDLYPQFTNISIDHGIMERTDNVFVIPSYFGWCDLGTWESIYENSERDYLGNAVYGDNVMIIDSNDCFVKVPNTKLTVLQGLEKFIVVDTPDVLLICERTREQQIKEYVAEVKRNKGERYL